MTINGRKSVPMSLLWYILKIFSTTLFLCGFQIIQAWQRTPFPNALARNKAQRGVTFFSKPEPFYLKWLSGWCVTTCYGCGNKIWAGFTIQSHQIHIMLSLLESKSVHIPLEVLWVSASQLNLRTSFFTWKTFALHQSVQICQWRKYHNYQRQQSKIKKFTLKHVAKRIWGAVVVSASNQRGSAKVEISKLKCICTRENDHWQVLFRMSRIIFIWHCMYCNCKRSKQNAAQTVH